jgi:glycine reductase
MERLGLPAVQVCAIVPIALTVGANRIVPAVAIPHPTGNPNLPKHEELSLRKEILQRALKALGSNIETQTVFK